MILHALKLTYQFMPHIPGESRRSVDTEYDTDRMEYKMVLRITVHGQYHAVAFMITRFDYESMADRVNDDYLERSLKHMCDKMKAQI
ncbi:hypothetical protein D3C75_333070 [compost metagenome]